MGRRNGGRLAAAAAGLAVLALCGTARAMTVAYTDADSDIWLSSPDGAVRQRVTTNGRDIHYYGTSMRDDGVVVSSSYGRNIWLYHPDGTSAGGPWLAPMCSLSTSPYDPDVLPSGGLVLYWYIRSTCVYPNYNIHAEVTMMSDGGPTINENVYPHYSGYTYARWIGASAVFGMARADRVDLEPDLSIIPLTPRPFYATPDGSDVDSFDYSRTGDMMMVETSPAGDLTSPSTLRLVKVASTPVGSGAGPATTELCTLPGFAPQGAKPRWSPDATMISWTGADGVYVSPAPAAAGGACALQPRLLAAGARNASWGTLTLATPAPSPGPAPAPTPTPPGPTPPGAVADTVAPRVTLTAVGARLAPTLGRGYTTTISCSEACTVQARLLAARTTVASGGARLAAAGRARVRLRFTAAGRRVLRRRARVRLTLRVTVSDAAGNRTTRTAAVLLRR